MKAIFPLRILLVAVLVPLMAGACARERAPYPHGVPGFAVQSRVIGAAAEYVEVEAQHQSYDDRIERIALVTPGGTEIEPEETRRESLRGPRAGRPYSGSVGVGTGYGARHSFFGIGIAFPLVLGKRGYARAIYRTRATFKVPDPESYRRDPSKWSVAIHMRHRKDGPFTIKQPAPVPGR